MGQIVFQATLGGQVAVAGPNTASSFTLTLPAATDTLVGKATTDTLTNKTLTSPTITGATLTTSAFNGTVGATTPSTGAFTTVTATSITNSGLTSGRVTYAGASGLLTDSATLTYNGTTLTATTGANFCTTSGNVGIGTTSPTTKLDVLGSGDSELRLRAGSDAALIFSETTANKNWKIKPSGGDLYWQYSATAYNSGYSSLMVLNSSGNVGIGTSSPSTKLHVEQSTTGDAFKVARGGNYIIMGGSGSGTQYIKGYEGVVAFGNEFSGATTFLTSNTERMRITSGGLVGIGLTSYNLPLSVVADANGQNVQLNGRTGDDFGQIFFRNFGGANNLARIACDSNAALIFGTGSQTAPTVPTERMRIDSSGNVGIGITNPTSRLHLSTASGSTAMTMSTNNNQDANATLYNDATNFAIASNFGSTGIKVKFALAMPDNAMTLDSSGNLLVGTTTSGETSSTGFRVLSNGQVASTESASTNASFSYLLYSTGASAYRFYVGLGGTIYATSTSITAISDQSLKTNIKPLETGLAEVMRLQPRRFDWINGDATNVAGFVAQEVQEVLPDLVGDYKYSDTETKLGLKMGDMLPTLVKAIQEQQALIESLTTRLTALENK